MPKPRPSAPIRDMLVSRDIALWDCHNYNTLTGRPTMKDPVSVCLVTPRAIERMFYGRGVTADEAVADALARNPGLHADQPGIMGALARCENALHALESLMWRQRLKNNPDSLDDDVPF